MAAEATLKETDENETNLTPVVDDNSRAELDKLFSAADVHDREDEDDAPEPADDAPEPADDAPEPADDAPEPADDTPEPADDDPYKEDKLPPHTSPKASEGFNALKEKARQREAELQKQLEELKASRTEDGTVPDEVTRELQELRALRQKVAIDHDPEFKKAYDDQLAAHTEAIYGKLKSAGLTDLQLTKIKQLGGWDKVDKKAILDKLPHEAKLYIEGRMQRSLQVQEDRDAAIEKAQEEAKGQPWNPTTPGPSFEDLSKEADAVFTGLTWVEKAVDAKAPEADRKQVENYNKAIRENRERVSEYLKDDSPRSRAELAVGTVMAHTFQKVIQAQEAQIRGLNEQLAKIKDARKFSSRKPSGIGTPGGRAPGDYDNRNAQEALEALFAEVEE